MQLTPAQKTTFKAAILAETDPTLVQLRTDGSTGLMADWYNGATTFIVWNSKTPVDDIYNAITWKNFTPTDAADNTVTYQNRAIKAQVQLDALRTIIRSSLQTVDMARNNIQQGLKDALQNLPTGTSGALLDAGYNGVKTASERFSTRAEKIFATGTGTAGSPGNNGPEGTVSNEDIIAILAS